MEMCPKTIDSPLDHITITPYNDFTISPYVQNFKFTISPFGKKKIIAPLFHKTILTYSNHPTILPFHHIMISSFHHLTNVEN